MTAVLYTSPGPKWNPDMDNFSVRRKQEGDIVGSSLYRFNTYKLEFKIYVENDIINIGDLLDSWEVLYDTYRKNIYIHNQDVIAKKRIVILTVFYMLYNIDNSYLSSSTIGRGGTILSCIGCNSNTGQFKCECHNSVYCSQDCANKDH